MLLESRLNDDTTLFIDCETVGGFDKSSTSDELFHPDEAIQNVCRIAGQVASELAASARAAAGTKPAPAGLELEFSNERVPAECVLQEAGIMEVRGPGPVLC